VAFFGTLVLARPAGLLVHEDAVLGFGYQHEHVWQLDDGWQLLETRGLWDPQDFAAAGERFVVGTGGPILAVYVNDGDCFGGYAATPDGWATLFHLPTDMAPCTYLHRPEPRARTREAVAGDLERWARTVGLAAVPAQIRALAAFEFGTAPERGSTFARVLLPALGVSGGGASVPTVIDLGDEPWCSIIGFLGLARRAHNRRVEREDGDPVGAEQPWERAAIELEAEIWDARHRPDADIADLRERAEQLCGAYMEAEQRRLPRWRT
jgi:hypothetical protein